MRFQYLGTAAAEGWPAPFCHCELCEQARKLKGKNYRSRPQVIVNNNLLMDYGPDTFYHSMQFELQLDNVRTVLLTHSHSDHFHPLDLILRAAPYAMGMVEEKMNLYGNAKCRKLFEELCKDHEAPPQFNNYVGFTEVKALHTFISCGYEITPLKAVHDPAEDCLLYAVKEPGGKTFFYGNDTGAICEETWEGIKGMHFDLVSLDCTHGIKAAGLSHLNLEEASKIRKKMLEAGCADSNTKFVITHFSHGCCPIHEELEKLAEAEGFLTAYDGMVIDIV